MNLKAIGINRFRTYSNFVDERPKKRDTNSKKYNFRFFQY